MIECVSNLPWATIGITAMIWLGGSFALGVLIGDVLKALGKLNHTLDCPALVGGQCNCTD